MPIKNNQGSDNIPQLRFPEFTGEWEKKKLGEVADKNVKWSLTGGPFGSDLKASDYVEEGVRVIQLQNMGDGEFIDTSKIYTSNKKADKLLSCNIYPNEIIISKMGDPVARACIIPNIEIRYLMCSDGIRLVVDKKHFDNYFIFLSINYKKFREEALSKSTGSTRKRIGLSELKEIQVSYPSLPEQTKIATFLTAVDEKIQALKKKHSLLEQYKKGVMQKLFSQETEERGSRTPLKNNKKGEQLRFKDENGNDFPDWEVKKFGEYIKLYRGSSPRPINLFITKESKGVNWIKIGDTKNCKNYLIDNVEEKITIEGAKKSREVFKGELILANSMSFGKTYLLDLDGCIYDGWFVLREFEKHFNREYLHQLLNSDYLQKQYKILSTGGVVQNISSEIVYDTFLLKPCLAEQTAIANFLSSLDEKINQTQRQIEKTETWKKGLLQKMFC